MELNKSENDKYGILSHMWNLKYKMNITKLKKGHRYRKQISGFSGEMEGRRRKIGVREGILG